jgi:hypothetical protein
VTLHAVRKGQQQAQEPEPERDPYQGQEEPGANG